MDHFHGSAETYEVKLKYKSMSKPHINWGLSGQLSKDDPNL